MKILWIFCLLLATCASVGTQRAASTAGQVEIPAYDASEDIVRHLGYTASYNHTTLCPDRVAWELTADEVTGTLAHNCWYRR